MLETIQSGNVREIIATDGWLHRKGSAEYPRVRRCTLLPSQSPDDFEEIPELPLYTEAEYAKRVEQLIRTRYTLSQELAVQRQRYTKPAEFEAYDAYAEQCKADARAQLAAEAQAAPAIETTETTETEPTQADPQS